MRTLEIAAVMASLVASPVASGCGGSESDPNADATSEGSGASAGSAAGGDGSAGAGAGATGGAGAGGTPTFEGYTRVDTGNGTAMMGGADIGIAPSGEIHVSWVDEVNGSLDVSVARSTDGGQTFAPPVQVDDATIVPLVTMARHPYVAADAARVAVTLNDQGGAVYLFLSDNTDPLMFGAPILVGQDVPTEFRDFPKPVFLDDGSVAISWQGYPASGGRIFVSRESDGFTSQAASSGAPGVPCDCCPQDMLLTGAGDLLVAFRNNDDDVREFWMAKTTSGAMFSSWAPISDTEGIVDNCPMQGVRLARAGGANHLAVWSSRGDNPGAVTIGSSDDDGASWSGGTAIEGFSGDEPTLAIGGSGRVFVTAVTGSGASALTYSDDGGATWATPEPLQSPDGALGVPQAEGGAQIAALAAVSEASTVWLRRME